MLIYLHRNKPSLLFPFRMEEDETTIIVTGILPNYSAHNDLMTPTCQWKHIKLHLHN